MMLETLGLKPGSNNLVHDPSLLENPLYQFVPIEASAILTPTASNVVVRIASYESPVPAIQLLPGRTVLVVTDQENSNVDWSGIPGLKFKGGGGQEQTEVSKYLYVLPDPTSKYGGAVKTYHLGIDKDVRFSTVAGRDKPQYGMGLTAARNEYQLHTILANNGELALPALMYGKLVFKSTGEDVVTTFKPIERLGVSVSVYNPEYERLTEKISFLFFETGPRFDVVPFSKNLEGGKPAIFYIQNYLDYIKITAQLKRDSIIIAKVARHACHADNVICKGTNIKLTDLDSAINLAEVDKNSWGPQLFRDVSFDLLRVVEQLSLMAYTPTYVKLMTDSKIKPLHTFLQTFFSGLIEDNQLIPICNKLHDKYCMFLINNQQNLAKLALDYRGSTFNNMIEYSKSTQAEWHVFHYGFLPEVLECCYNIMLKSKLQNGDFKIKVIPEDLRALRFKKAAKDLIDEIWKNYFNALKRQSHTN